MSQLVFNILSGGILMFNLTNTFCILQGHNIILFSNHQTEADPAIIGLLLEQTLAYFAEKIVRLIIVSLFSVYFSSVKLSELYLRFLSQEIEQLQTHFASLLAWEGPYDFFYDPKQKVCITIVQLIFSYLYCDACLCFRNLLCVYSKKHMHDTPELVEMKRKANTRSLKEMALLLRYAVFSCFIFLLLF